MSISNFLKQSILLLPLLLFYACGSGDVVRPLRKNIQELVFASGTIEWDNVYNLTAQTDGVLSAVDFEIGDACSPGKLLAIIDNSGNKINETAAGEQFNIAQGNVSNEAPLIQQLESSIKFAEEKFQQEAHQAERFAKLYLSKGVSQVEFENAQLSKENAKSNLESLQKQLQHIRLQAKQNLISAKAQLENAKVTSQFNKVITPQQGIVIKKLKSTGDYVRKGDVIAVIADASNIEIVLNVDEKSISKVHLDQLVYVRLNTTPSHVYQAKISEILSAFDQQMQSFTCKANFTSKVPHLLYGTQLEANILVGEKHNALVIPRSYLGFGNLVQMKSDGKPRIVKTGIISSDYAEITGGLDINDELIPIKP